MNLNPKLTSLAKIGFKYIEFVENAQSEESVIYFKENKFGEDVPIKKKNKCDKFIHDNTPDGGMWIKVEEEEEVCIFSCCVIYRSTRTYIVPDQDGYRWYVFVLILLEIFWRRTPRLYSKIVLDNVIKYFLQNMFLNLSLKNASHHLKIFCYVMFSDMYA